MTKFLQVYRCDVCGNVVEVLHTGIGTLVCCGQPMELKGEKWEDEGTEKHLPLVESTEEGIKITVGSVPHPMGDKHHIEWIEVVAKGNERIYRKFLSPGDDPVVTFPVKNVLFVRAYCNIHGLWKDQE
ncbi:MAG: desulfoferrodoxin [Thermoplasmata archaeon]